MLWLDQWDTTDLSNLRLAKVGHFFGIRELATKCSLGNTMNKIRSEFPAVSRR